MISFFFVKRRKKEIESASSTTSPIEACLDPLVLRRAFDIISGGDTSWGRVGKLQSEKIERLRKIAKAKGRAVGEEREREKDGILLALGNRVRKDSDSIYNASSRLREARES